MTLVAYPHPVGSRVSFVDCYGANERDGEVISTPGTYSVRVRLASGAVYWVAAGLITGRVDRADAPKPMSIFWELYT